MQGERQPNAACPRCGAAFRCGAPSFDAAAEDAAAFDCWCMALPRIAMPDAPGGCLCPDCLRAEIAQQGGARG